jgi:hypothetical protein
METEELEVLDLVSKNDGALAIVLEKYKYDSGGCCYILAEYKGGRFERNGDRVFQRYELTRTHITGRADMEPSDYGREHPLS